MMPKVVSSNKGKGRKTSSGTLRWASAESSKSPPQSSTSHSAKVNSTTADNAKANSTETKDYWCVMKGETTSNSFKVSLPLTADVSDLKNRINDDLKLDMPAKDLTLWKQSILPAADDGKTHITVSATDAELHPKAVLTNVSIINNKSIYMYIIVQWPKSGNATDFVFLIA